MTIQYTDPRAVELRAWLNERYTHYLTHPCTDAQLSAWLDQAEESEGLVEIRAKDSVSGTPETLTIDLDDSPSISDDDIRALSDEAGEHGDLAQVEICARALAGSARDRKICERVITDAQAQ